eukprot:scaffold3759_cov61-Cyclotella_meneghiniana.AAC.7
MRSLTEPKTTPFRPRSTIDSALRLNPPPSAAAEIKRRELIKESIEEEKKEISSSVRLSEWFTIIQSKSSPIHCRIDELTNISTRSLSKLLWNDNRIVSLDVSNLNLSDISGSFLARALSNNNTLRKLELGGNQFGSKCVSQIAKSLVANKTSALSFLSLESNLLLTGENSIASIALFAEAVGKNTSLLSLSLWRCGLCLESGRLLAEAISKGENKLVSLEVGYNHFDSLDVEEINRKDRAARLAKEAELAKKERLVAEMRIQEETANRKEVENTKWLEDEAKGRAEARRQHAEEVKLEQEKEAQQLKAMEHARKMEEARVQALAKKQKGGGKKGKAKKK